MRVATAGFGRLTAPGSDEAVAMATVSSAWLFSADTIDFTQSYVKGFKQHPTTMLYGLEGAWLDKA